MIPSTFLKNTSTAPRINLAGDIYSILATGKETGGAYAAFEFIVPPGGGPPPHTHSREDEMFYVIEGELVFTVAGKRSVAPTGTFVHAVRGVSHFFRNESMARARAFVWVQPAGLEEFFLAVGRPIGPNDGAYPPTPEEVAKLITLAPQYGMTLDLGAH